MSIGKVELAEHARRAMPELTGIQANAIAEEQMKLVNKRWSHDVRFHRWQTRNLGKALGKAGHTIHELRGEIALLRQERTQKMSDFVARVLRDTDGMVETVDLDKLSNGEANGATSEVSDNPLSADELRAAEASVG